MYIVGYTSVRSILSIAVAEGSVACAQDRTTAAAAASATDATISHCLDERKGKKIKARLLVLPMLAAFYRDVNLQIFCVVKKKKSA